MSTTRSERNVVCGGFSFGEGPRWHDGKLYFSDMHGHRVLTVAPDGTTDTVLTHAGPVSGLGWLPDGRLLAVAMDGFLLRLDPTGPAVHADLRGLAPHDVNDMVVDSEGNAYVGQFGFDHFGGEPSVPAPLLLVRPDGTVEVVAEDMAVANGMALTETEDVLIVAESAGRRLTAFDTGHDGMLANRRAFAELPEPPDGICLDAEGAAWVAQPVGGRFVRVSPGGEIAEVVELEEGRHAIACVLGDVDRRTLYLTTASTLGDPQQSLATRAARVERLRVNVPGAGRP